MLEHGSLESEPTIRVSVELPLVVEGGGDLEVEVAEVVCLGSGDGLYGPLVGFVLGNADEGLHGVSLPVNEEVRA